MKNIFDYINNNSNKTFLEMEFNEIDNLVFSQIVYINFTNIVSELDNKITLEKACNMFLNNKHKDLNKKRYELINKIKDSRRYKDTLLSNYVYRLNGSGQFSALTMDIDKDITVVAYEGTDATLMGWKEDFELSYKFPISSQKDAIKYLNRVGFKKKNIILLGHSKGGNLALVSGMYCKFYIRRKIVKIYSNDGPGLLKEEYFSKKYQDIKNKYIHIVSKNSVIGLLLNSSNRMVINTNASGISAHSVFTWLIEGNTLVPGELSKFSIDLNNNINSWLNNFSYIEIEGFVDSLFNILRDSHIISFKELFTLKIKDMEVIIRNTQNVNSKTKEMLNEFFLIVKNYYVNNFKEKIKSRKI